MLTCRQLQYALCALLLFMPTAAQAMASGALLPALVALLRHGLMALQAPLPPPPPPSSNCYAAHEPWAAKQAAVPQVGTVLAALLPLPSPNMVGGGEGGGGHVSDVGNGVHQKGCNGSRHRSGGGRGSGSGGSGGGDGGSGGSGSSSGSGGSGGGSGGGSSSGASSATAWDVLLAAARVMINVTNHNEAACAIARECGALEALAACCLAAQR